jgi:2-polyprenyl-6-methoxyphenol hydroxylase-like FAD-dependent oxidoreductase
MSIGIVGTGISGLHLALRLYQLGIDATLYAAARPDEIRGGPPPNFVTRFASTRAREATLGITNWASSEFDNPWMHVSVEVPNGLSFQGQLASPASSVDFRIYLATLLEEHEARGGNVVYRKTTDQADLATIAADHDLVVVAAGRGALTDTFPRDPARSPYTSAPRSLVGGLFRGIEALDPPGMAMYMVPGVGEIHVPAYHSFDGPVNVVLIEAVPDGPFGVVTETDHRDDPDRFVKQVLDLITTHAPTLRARIDEREFALTRPIDMLRGALVPVVRQGWARVADDKYALAIGDAWIVNDPLTAQGANLGSYQAFELADALLANAGAYDDRFCRTISERMWSVAEPVVAWTNMFIGEPPPQIFSLLTAAATDQRVADAFAGNLDRPAAMWHSISRQENTDEFIANVLMTRSEA